ncbi:radical SAM family heme chaperone HemW [Corynebacterium caspium]|uniref:radical SAM family heme chaperone HemW n=1 Tax=Corynebacterium caspium TaxID=234828 RepID=UPI000375F76E|nr:radical SAM family heme chaperone HemW [Corynebacterium caspium]WKD58890.1 Oxygen-independent coproporphyrinogen-III oxidase 1 [Corynebacterium caspium DSM 44850]
MIRSSQAPVPVPLTVTAAASGRGATASPATPTTPVPPAAPTPAPQLAQTVDPSAEVNIGNNPFGIYLHVPFCATRCGYCDFNTYTPGELGSSASPQSYLEAISAELRAGAELLAQRGQLKPADTVFIGGGTPSLLGAGGLSYLLNEVRQSFGLAPAAEITTESNPDSTSPEFFSELKAAGFTRISLGMQSAAAHVLQVLQRTHTPGRPVAAAKEAKAAGFEHVNLDMIYGTPTETDQDVQRTLEHIMEAGVDHVSAYSLIIEDGTAMARKVRRGEFPAPDEDVLARRYELIDAYLTAAGFSWYEVSNWAKPGGECHHNEIYWSGGNWWGAGPGAHSHLVNERFFNTKHPARYAQMMAAGNLPIQAVEYLEAAELHTEQVMLGLRLRRGIPAHWLANKAAKAVQDFIDRGLLEQYSGPETMLRVTEPGRLLVDGIVTDLLLAEE